MDTASWVRALRPNAAIQQQSTDLRAVVPRQTILMHDDDGRKVDDPESLLTSLAEPKLSFIHSVEDGLGNPLTRDHDREMGERSADGTQPASWALAPQLAS